MAEDHAPNLPMGPTLAKIWIKEFTTLLKGDRFNFKMKNSYHPLLRKYLSHDLEDIWDGVRRMEDIILDNTGIREKELPDSIWRTS